MTSCSTEVLGTSLIPLQPEQLDLALPGGLGAGSACELCFQLLHVEFCLAVLVAGEPPPGTQPSVAQHNLLPGPILL